VGFEVLEMRAMLSTVLVTSALDVVNPNDNVTTLREAIMVAASGDTVSFSPSLTRNGAVSIRLRGKELTVDGDLKINGPGADLVTVDANDASRAFDIVSGKVQISGLRIANGAADQGGGILNAGNLTLTRCTLDQNAGTDSGGGIFSFDTLKVQRCDFRTNFVTGFGGGAIFAHGSVDIRNSTFTGNSAFNGGAVFSDGTLVLKGSTLRNNSADFGGAVSNDFGAATIDGTTLFARNDATQRGGAIFNQEGDVTVNDVTLRNNTTDGQGGAVFNEGNMTIRGSELTNNFAGDGEGGAIANRGTLLLADSTLRGNSAALGGAIFSGQGSGSDGRLTARGCMISGNEATESGGGIYNDEFSTAIIATTTLRRNEASRDGGGIFNKGELRLNSSVDTGNTAPAEADLFSAPGSVLTTHDSVVGEQN
jgi:predicted outer membrane repeat protein